MRVIIVGGGISGLSLAHSLLEKGKEIDLLVLEAEPRPGGKIWTDRHEGFLLETGVNGFLDNKPRTLELAKALSLSPLRSSDAARKRFVYSERTLHRLPENPIQFLLSGLISLPGKIRIFMEPFIKKYEGTGDESLADFARRRLGSEAFEKLIDPMASGIYAGDPGNLSLKSCFPRIHELESTYGSLIRAMFKLKAEAKRQGSGKKVGAGPGGTLTSFSGGMEDIITALKAMLGARLVTNARVSAIEKTHDGYAVHRADGVKDEAECVVVASPAYAAAEMLGGLDSVFKDLLGGIPYPSLAVVCTAFRKEALKERINAFGFLAPKSEERKILGTLFDSCIFTGRAPEDYVLMRSMVGGARASDLALMEDERLITLVLSELRDIMDIKAAPEFTRVYRHEKAIPQYTIGHPERLAALDAALERFKGLYLTGNAYRGIGVNDCVENSHRLSERIIKEAA